MSRKQRWHIGNGVGLAGAAVAICTVVFDLSHILWLLVFVLLIIAAILIVPQMFVRSDQ